MKGRQVAADSKGASTPRWAAYLIMPIAPLCWGGNIVLARGVADLIPPVAFAFWRWTAALVILLPLAWPQVRRDWPLAVKGWRIFLALGLTGIASFNTLLYKAVHTTTAINGALIQTTMPGFIILMSLVFFREKISLRQFLGAAACVVGAALVVLHGRLESLVRLQMVPGDLLMMAEEASIFM